MTIIEDPKEYKWYEQSVSAYIITKYIYSASGSTPDTPYYVLKDHTCLSFDLPIDFDAWFTIRRIYVIKKENLEEYMAFTEKLPTNIYYYEDNKIYKQGVAEAIDIAALGLANLIDTNLVYTDTDQVSVVKMRECYINLCKQIFESQAVTKCYNKASIDSELIFKRDFVWAAINIIQYLTESNMLEEANRVISVINGCNGLCNNSNSNSDGECGCSKK